MVEQPPGRGDHDLRAAAEGVDLRLEADAAIDGGRADRPARAVGSNAFLDLERQLARRSEHQAADRLTGRATRQTPAGARARRGPGWHGAAGGSAARRPPSCPCPSGRWKEVAAGEHDRDRISLDGGRLGIALGGHRSKKVGRQPELIERGRCRRRLDRLGRRRGGCVAGGRPRPAGR